MIAALDVGTSKVTCFIAERDSQGELGIIGIGQDTADDPRPPLRSILVGDKHYIAWEDGREELYDLATDPGEQHDLSDSATVDLQAFRKALAAFP